MGKHFALTLQLPAYNTGRANIRSSRKGVLHGIKTQHIGVALFASLVVLFLVYLVQVNNFATKGYEIKQLQTRIGGLQSQYKQLETQAAQLQSIQRVQGDQNTASMVPVAKINYIQTTALTQR